MKNIAKKLFAIVSVFAILVASIANVDAAGSTIKLGPGSKVTEYISGLSFYYKKTADGKYLYCLQRHKNLAENINANLVRGSKNIDGGLIYILQNGYPVKNITGDKEKDYYITQVAVWWYLDKVHGRENLSSSFKKGDATGIKKHIKNLYEAGYSHRNDKYGIGDTSIVLNTSSKSMALNNDYYLSDGIKATGNYLANYTISIANAPSGTKIIKGDGLEVPYTDKMVIGANDTFKVKIPASGVKEKAAIKITATTPGALQFMAYEYQPTDSNMQNVALLERVQKSASTELNLEVDSSKVSITKIDANTKQPVAGAKLVLRNEKGEEVTSWESTVNAHVIRNLANGFYTIEEVSAPTGYVVSKDKKTFTISDTNRNVEINFENKAKTVVVNITKVDQATNAPLAGAVLVVKDWTNKEVARFTTTNESYVLTDLPNGTYSVTEVSAPAGYLTSNEVITFTVDDDHLTHQIKFVNAKETVVPDTANNTSILLMILGIVITGAGVLFIYKNGQKA